MTKFCKECKHELEDHGVKKKIPCSKIIFVPPTKEEQEHMPDFGGTYEFCKCNGYKP